MRAAAAASGAAVRRRMRKPRRRRLEVTSPKSVLVRGHLSSGQLGCGRLRGYPLSAGPDCRPRPLQLSIRSAIPNLSRVCHIPPCSFSLAGRIGPSRAARVRSLTMASLFKKKTVDGEFRAWLKRPSSAFPRLIWGTSGLDSCCCPWGRGWIKWPHR